MEEPGVELWEALMVKQSDSLLQKRKNLLTEEEDSMEEGDLMMEEDLTMAH